MNWVRVESQWTLRCRSIKKFILNLMKIEGLGDFKQEVRLSDFCFVLFYFKGISVGITENEFEEEGALINSCNSES